MPSHDKTWTIERYPYYKETESGQTMVLVGYSYGCPDLNMMGYVKLRDLLNDIAVKVGT